MGRASGPAEKIPGQSQKVNHNEISLAREEREMGEGRKGRRGEGKGEQGREGAGRGTLGCQPENKMQHGSSIEQPP